MVDLVLLGVYNHVNALEGSKEWDVITLEDDCI